MVPVPKPQGISEGYLRPGEGIIESGTGPGIDRGGINWNGQCIRVMGSKLVLVGSDGYVVTLADVLPGTQVKMDYSFDRLAIASSGYFFYWNGATLTQVTDPDLGLVISFIWVDGYFMLADGTNLIVTELNNPTSINPLKYGSAEADPDRIVAILKLGNEPYALNRYTTEVFENVGGDLFPFARIEGAQLQRGCIGTHACTVFMDSIAFLGSGRKEAPAIWIGKNGATQKLSTGEIDKVLKEYSENDLAAAVMEARVDEGHQFLYLHLSDQALVYDGAASQVAGEPVWFTQTTSLVGKGTFQARNFVWCYDKWLCGDPTSSRHGYMTNSESHHYGELNGWDFGTVITYNGGAGAIFHEIELVCLTGNAAIGANPVIWTSYSLDGINWSVEKGRSAGKQGERSKRLNWLGQGNMRHWRCQRFRGTSDAHISVARIEARIEALNV